MTCQIYLMTVAVIPLTLQEHLTTSSFLLTDFIIPLIHASSPVQSLLLWPHLHHNPCLCGRLSQGGHRGRSRQAGVCRGAAPGQPQFGRRWEPQRLHINQMIGVVVIINSHLIHLENSCLDVIGAHSYEFVPNFMVLKKKSGNHWCLRDTCSENHKYYPSSGHQDVLICTRSGKLANTQSESSHFVFVLWFGFMILFWGFEVVLLEDLMLQQTGFVQHLYMSEKLSNLNLSWTLCVMCFVLQRK